MENEICLKLKYYGYDSKEEREIPLKSKEINDAKLEAENILTRILAEMKEPIRLPSQWRTLVEANLIKKGISKGFMGIGKGKPKYTTLLSIYKNYPSFSYWN